MSNRGFNKFANVEARTGYEIVDRAEIIELKLEPELKPVFWAKAVSRLFTIGFLLSLLFLVFYLAESFGVDMDFDFLMQLIILGVNV